MSLRQDRVAELLRQHVASFLERESNRRSLITVTRCDISSDLKRSTIYITVLPRDYEEHALLFVKRKLKDIRAHIKKNITIKHIPFFDVKIDLGELHRQKIDDLINNT